MSIVNNPFQGSILSQPLPTLIPVPSRLEKLVENAKSPEGFWWMTGIEGTTIPHIEADEFEWIQHYRFWNEDLTMIRSELGANAIRLCFPWYKINPEPGKFDWDWMDKVVERAVALNFQITLDPIHFGTPLWMKEAFGDPDFPQYAADYFQRLARRYGQYEQIAAYVPHNEPTITATFGGLMGEWPPYQKGRESFNRLLVNIAKGIILSQQAVKAEVEDPVFLYIDAVDQVATRQLNPSEHLLAEIELINQRRFLCYDLLNGRVDMQHPLAAELLQSGVTENDLTWFEDNSISLDILGLDFYSYSEAWVSETSHGELVQERELQGPETVRLIEEGFSSEMVNALAPRPAGIYEIIKAYNQRYNRPVILTETDYMGSIAERAAWLKYSVEEVARARAEHIPVLGYTWWGATDHLNWGMALKERDSIHPVGLYSLVPQADGVLERVRTPLVDAFRQYVGYL